MSFIPSWDDLEDNDNPIMAKAKESLQQLDTTEAEKEMTEHAERIELVRDLKAIGAISDRGVTDATRTIDESPRVDKLVVPSEVALTAMQKAELAVEGYHKESFGGERVLASNKRLINAKTDLNQLIPFKYGWTWSMYLESSSKHWMPAEVATYAKDIAEWGKYAILFKKIVSRLTVNYMMYMRVCPPTMLVNLYRLSTSPEVRQYILRQVFEEQVFHHSARHIVESFDLEKSNVMEHMPDSDTYRHRNNSLYGHMGPLNDLTLSTESPEQIRDFVVALAGLYGGIRTLYHLVPLYQVWKAHRTHGYLMGVRDNMERVSTDMARQLEFGIRYITSIEDENPGTLNDEVRVRIESMFKDLINANLDLASTLCVDGDDYTEIKECSIGFAGYFLSYIGLPSDKYPAPTKRPDYMHYFLSLSSADHDNPNVSLGGGGLDGW